MGVVVSLDEHRAARAPRGARTRGRACVELFFDLGDPFSYLAAERVERAFDAVTWTPVTGPTLDGRMRGVRALAEERARQLRMPLVWPERFPAPVPRAMRVAALAIELGRGPEFALAASRLAFCGGFDLEDPEILAEAAAAAGVEPKAVGEINKAVKGQRLDWTASPADGGLRIDVNIPKPLLKNLPKIVQLFQ